MTDPLPRLALVQPRRMQGWVRARAAAPRISRERAGQILEQYGLRILRSPTNLSQTWRNPLVIVRTSDGKKVLKQYRETSSPESIAHEHSIIEHLEAHDFPAVRVNRTLDGQTMVEMDGHMYGLFDHVPGRHFATVYITRAARRSLHRIAGRTLGRFHRAMAGFRPAASHHLGFNSDGGRERDLEWCLSTIDQVTTDGDVRADPSASDLFAWLSDRSGYLRESLTETAEAIDGTHLPRTVIHGDYGIHNLLFLRDRTAVVHDFELARSDWRLLDIGITFKRLRPANRGVFLTGYRATNEIQDAELDHLPLLWRHHLLTGAVRSWYGYARFGGVERLVTARDRIAAVENGVPRRMADLWS